MRLVVLVSLALLLEIGWLALWPLAIALSHSPLFTTAILHSSGSLADPLGSASYVVPATLLALDMLWLAGVYAVALLLLDRARATSRGCMAIVLGGAVLFQVTLLAMPGLFSQDVFSYIAYGRVAAVYGLNPYVWPPSVLRDPSLPWVADVWRTYPSPYGPFWVNLQWLLARTFSGVAIAEQALIYRGLASLLLLANLGLAWRLLGRLTPLRRSHRLTALAALAWNPLVLFEIAGDAHNDVLMVTFCLLGLSLFETSGRGLRSTLAFSLGALVKYLSGLGLVWLALASAARERGLSGRARRVLALSSVGLVCAVATSAPWLELPDSLDPLLTETAGVGYVNSLPHALLGWLLGGLERPLVLGAFGVYLLWECRCVWAEPDRTAVARALARSSLVYILVVAMSVQPWYFCLPVTISITLGVRHPLARVSLTYAALALPALYLSYYLREQTPVAVFVAYALAPLLVLLPEALTARAGARAHVPAAVHIRQDEQRARAHPVARTIVEDSGR